jgi:hypothetical protein
VFDNNRLRGRLGIRTASLFYFLVDPLGFLLSKIIHALVWIAIPAFPPRCAAVPIAVRKLTRR